MFYVKCETRIYLLPKHNLTAKMCLPVVMKFKTTYLSVVCLVLSLLSRASAVYTICLNISTRLLWEFYFQI